MILPVLHYHPCPIDMDDFTTTRLHELLIWCTLVNYLPSVKVIDYVSSICSH